MTIEEMKKIKKERGLTNAMVAEMTELPLSTVKQKSTTGPACGSTGFWTPWKARWISGPLASVKNRGSLT